MTFENTSKEFMTMIQIALCDDEQKILNEVSQHISKYVENKKEEERKCGIQKR